MSSKFINRIYIFYSLLIAQCTINSPHSSIYRKEAQLQIDALKEQLNGANGLVARLEAGEDESQLKIKQLESKRDSFKRQAAELQRQLDTITDVSEQISAYSNKTIIFRI